MAKLTIEEIIAAVKELTVIELNDLVKAAEEEFGVSAAAGVAVVAGPAAGGAAEEKNRIRRRTDRSWFRKNQSYQSCS